MDKISITIDVMKIEKKYIVERRYHDKSNHEVICKDLKLEVIPLREPKMIKEGDTWQMWKTHFVALAQTKEEKAEKKKSQIVGDGIMFKQKGETQAEPTSTEEISVDQIPF